MLLVIGGCTKETTLEPLPLDEFTVLEAIPVRCVEDPYTGGIIVLCKRAIDDPVLASALFFDANGTAQGELNFSGLNSKVENITFGVEAWSITDLVPRPDGTYLLIGVGIQTAIDDRIHLLVHHVGRTGSAVEPPVRRFVADKGTLVRATDTDELYRTKALGALRDTERLVVAMRYDRQEGPIVAGYHRTYQIALVAGVGSNGGPPNELANADHLLHGLLADGSGGTFTITDTINPAGPGKALKVIHDTWENDVQQPMWAVLDLRDAVPTGFRMQNEELILAGHYQVEADVRRPFFARGSTATDLQNGISYPLLASTDRTALIGSLTPTNDGFTVMCNIYDQAALSQRALRDDRFCDLISAQLASDGTVRSTTTIIPGKGLRALGAWAQGDLVAGAFHPFLNTDIMHAFVLRTTSY